MSTTIDQLLTTGQAARRLDRSTARIHQLIRSGDLPAVKTAIGHLIDPVDVERLRLEREVRADKREAVSR